MKLKTEVHVNLDLHFTNDDLVNGAELARLAAVCDGLYLLLKAQSPGQSVSRETPIAQLGAQVRQIEAVAESVSRETPVGISPNGAAPEPPAVYRQPTSRRWNFEKFDDRVRAEMKRLAGPGGTMPTTSRWDRERDQRLPTMTAVIRRYGCKTKPELAQRLGMAPAASTPAATNGHEPRRRL